MERSSRGSKKGKRNNLQRWISDIDKLVGPNEFVFMTC